jgi:hypothetical protein
VEDCTVNGQGSLNKIALIAEWIDWPQPPWTASRDDHRGLISLVK